MEFSQCFPIWNKLTPTQQERLRSVTDLQQVPRGTVIHDGSPECKGLVMVKSGQLRAYLLSDEGREITICRFFEMDICLFSASCVMPKKIWPVRSARYDRQSRTAVGHCQRVEYIAAVTI